MFAGKPEVFEACTVHATTIESLPRRPVLAHNDMGLQAAEIKLGRGVFWGVQYHPEYSYAEIAATARAMARCWSLRQLFADEQELACWIADMRDLGRDPRSSRLRWRHGLGPSMQEPRPKLAEIDNWLLQRVLPFHARRIKA